MSCALRWTVPYVDLHVRTVYYLKHIFRGERNSNRNFTDFGVIDFFFLDCYSHNSIWMKA